MTDLTPERRAALRETWLKPPGEYSVCIPARELTVLLDAADLLNEVRYQVRRGALCPMCSTGMTRQTVGLICQLCGTDYGKEPTR